MTDGFAVAPDDGEIIELPGWTMLVKVGAPATGGAMTVIHGRMHPLHAGPAEHVHDGHDESFLVLEGTLRFRLGDRYESVDAGGVAFAPRGHAHGFSNPSEQPACYMVMVTPSGYERYFRRVADYYLSTGELPDTALTAPWMAAEHTRLAQPI